MQKKNWFILIGALCFSVSFLHPVLCFLASIIAIGFLAIALSKETIKGWGINLYVLVAFGLIYLLVPSSMFTLSTDDTHRGSGSRVWAASAILGYTSDLGTLIVVGIPVLLLIASLYAFTVGNVEGGMTGIAKVIVIVVAASMFSWILARMGVQIPALQALESVANWVIAKANEIGDLLTDGIDGWSELLGKDTIPDAGDYPTTFEWTEMSIASNMTHNSITIMTSIPVVTSLLLVGIGWQWNKHPKTIQYIQGYLDTPTELGNANKISFLIFWLIEAFIVLAFYLSLDIEQFLARESLLYIIFFILTSIACLVMALGYGSPKGTNIKNFLIGNLIGLALLFILFNAFSQQQLLSTLELGNNAVTFQKILWQFLFVAPTENLLFLILPSAIVTRYYASKTMTAEDITTELQFLDFEMGFYQSIGNLNRKQQQELAKLTKRKIKLTRMQNKKTEIAPFTLSLVLWIISSFIFACYHVINSNLSFLVFWTSGLGFIYLFSGLILILISEQYGWFTGITVHAINNSISLILILLGGI